ncbi:hypothetical protein BJY01DRAFT_242575 [Aspergillus pseudoustus]|uniref:NACHT-NTPase and P-loop NTPases N-terminal domain-containing protein n=1 Tax=Aspergillus pseudoustus TaxID=1810923 RepID=A0ABR4KY24_9EURO
MAEIFGLVSGSIAVAETAGAVFKPKRLWKEVRNAPDYIDSLIDQLSLVQPLLTETEAELKEDEQLLTSSNAARLSLKYCKKILWDLDALAHDLRQQIEAKRRLSWGKAKVKFALEKEVIYNLQKRMQDALQLLGIAQQTYIIALAKRQPLLIAQQVSPLREAAIGFEDKFRKQPEKEPALDVAIRRAVASNGVDRRPLAWRYSKYLGSYTSHAYKAPDAVYHTRIQMPSWLTEKVWDICVQKASHGWMYSLRLWTIRQVPEEVFYPVMNGDVSTMKRLFEERHASPYDRDPAGWTLLHLATHKDKQSNIL